MNNPSFTRLIIVTLLSLIGAGLFLADRLVAVGVMLVMLSPAILMNTREREHLKKRFTTPLTKRQILRIVTSLMIVWGMFGVLLVILQNIPTSSYEQQLGRSSWDFGSIWSWTFRIAGLIPAAISLTKSWIRWYQSRSPNKTIDSQHRTSLQT